MDTIINMYAAATGLWKKVAAMLPLAYGAGSVLVGAGSILVQLGHSASTADALHLLGSLDKTNPNVVLIGTGLLALGVHTNHSENAAKLADHSEQLSPAGETKPDGDQGK